VALTPGTRLGPYEVIALIGAGGMGEVYKAHDTRLGRTVAVKRLLSDTQRFRDEARAIAALNHPHICQVYDVGPDYLVLEYIEGAPLAGPLSRERALTLGVQIASALEAAHARGVLHRDLKPANILVTPTGQAKLLDFGLAKLDAHDADVTRTLVGTVLGTAAYMSPEQARGSSVDERSDIFSFGTVMYELVSGHRAFGGATAAEVISSILRDEPPRLDSDAAVEGIVQRCLEKDPSRRFQSVAELLTALRAEIGTQAAAPDVEKPSLAVLPFADMSADKDQGWFSDGLAEEIITALAQLPDLRVTARTSAFAFRGKEQDIRSIAKALEAKHVLEGSVRRVGNRLRITAQLINASDGYHLWSQRYDRELADVFDVQDEIATAIAGALRVTLRGDRPTRRAAHTTSVAAYDAYLKGRQLQWTATTAVGPAASERARRYYEQALAVDPDFAACHVGIAHHLLLLATYNAMPLDAAMSGVREAAEQALRVDPSLPEAHAMLGIVSGIYGYDWKESERRFRRAMEYEPIPAEVHMWYGVFHLVPTGRAVEAIPHHRLALRDDPLNPTYRCALAEAFAASGQWEQSESIAREIVDFDGSQTWPLLLIAQSCIGQRRIPEAIEYISRYFKRLKTTFPEGAQSGLDQQFTDLRTVLTDASLSPSVPSSKTGWAFIIAQLLMLQGVAHTAADLMTQAIADRHPMAARFLGWNCWKVNPQDAALRAMINLPSRPSGAVG
jgi:TolB-like protein/predicted Ser/Thr protein kinase